MNKKPDEAPLPRGANEPSSAPFVCELANPVPIPPPFVCPSCGDPLTLLGKHEPAKPKVYAAGPNDHLDVPVIDHQEDARMRLKITEWRKA